MELDLPGVIGIKQQLRKVFRHFKSLSKTQYTVIADIN
jgi:hypothetical protein